MRHKAKDWTQGKKSRCGVCGCEYRYTPAWPYGDTCSSSCFYRDTRSLNAESHAPGKAKEHLPTKAGILDIGGYNE